MASFGRKKGAISSSSNKKDPEKSGMAGGFADWKNLGSQNLVQLLGPRLFEEALRRGSGT